MLGWSSETRTCLSLTPPSARTIDGDKDRRASGPHALEEETLSSNEDEGQAVGKKDRVLEPFLPFAPFLFPSFFSFPSSLLSFASLSSFLLLPFFILPFLVPSHLLSPSFSILPLHFLPFQFFVFILGTCLGCSGVTSSSVFRNYS